MQSCKFFLATVFKAGSVDEYWVEKSSPCTAPPPRQAKLSRIAAFVISLQLLHPFAPFCTNNSTRKPMGLEMQNSWKAVQTLARYLAEKRRLNKKSITSFHAASISVLISATHHFALFCNYSM